MSSQLRNRLRLSGVAAMAMVGSMSLGCAKQEMKPEEVLAALVAADQSARASFALVADARRPAVGLGPESSARTEIVRLSTDGTTVAREATVTYDQPASFVALDFPRTQASDYDEHGNLVLLRTTRSRALASGEINDTWDYLQSLTVSREGEVVADDQTFLVVTRDPPGPLNRLAAFDWLLMGLGRGFSDHLMEVTSITAGEAGLTQIEARGRLFDGEIVGTWTLVVETAAGYLVRAARFVEPDEEEPAFVASSAGTMSDGDLLMAARGRVRLTELNAEADSLTVELVELARDPDQTLIGRLTDALTGDLPGDADVVDNRQEWDYEPPVFEVTKGDCCDCQQSARFTRDECFHLPGDFIPPSPGHPNGQSRCPATGNFQGNPKGRLCINNLLRPRANCVQLSTTGTPSCRTAAAKGNWATQTLFLLTSNCPNAGTTQDYTNRLSLFSTCPACVPGGELQNLFSCDNPEPSCGGKQVGQVHRPGRRDCV